MKNLMFIFLLLPTMAMVQPNMDGITKAISNGDAQALSPYMDSSVEISILDDVDIYDKAQAVTVLKGFFSKNQPKSYSQMHQGTSKGKDSKYAIGNLTTANGAYRVYIYVAVENGKQLIQELRFDKE